jgi:hypothetical protein
VSPRSSPSPSPGIPVGNISWPGLDSDESWLPPGGTLAPDGPKVFRKPLLWQDAYTVDFNGRLSISGEPVGMRPFSHTAGCICTAVVICSR